jgi:hypothetical protein
MRLVDKCPTRRTGQLTFAGSGSCRSLPHQRLGRRAVGFEVDEGYCEIIAGRLEQGALDFGSVGA